ncbi:hypothetical protein V5F34_06055 [Xanthobacter autotrophicus]|uniref:hypothetical protein n=1 Tax=Xanthobacter autotrophicus TaxID=280 RepID=UPI0037276D8E
MDAVTLPPHLSRPWLRPEEASELVTILTGAPCSSRTLSTWRSRGGGPPFRKVRQRYVVYGLDDLSRWCRDTMSEAARTTSEVD